MLLMGVVTLLIGLLSTVGVDAGGHPYAVPTVGQVWPKPQMTMSQTTTVVVDQDQFSERLPAQIDSPDEPGVGSIISMSVWGVLRGLESLSQLLIPDEEGGFYVYSTQIMDFPRFAHRGFMIDTARHFLPLNKIKEMLDLMGMNKYNVLHWHIVDDQSFPYVSDVYPDLSAQGAWSSERVYTAADIADIITYATDRGIRVIPEFDTPGHTLSWGDGQPDLLTECYTEHLLPALYPCSGSPDGSYGPIDPSKESTYDFLTQLFTEVGSRFPDHYLHLGGDEVPFNCWQSNPAITEFMTQSNITSYEGLESYYITRLLDIVSNLPTANGYMVWQEVFDNNVDLASDTVVHIWKGSGTDLQEELASVTAGGFPTLLSSCWYLNRIRYGPDWYSYYECDPHDFTGTADQKSLVVGGEACMWSEWVDRTNLISRTWPRASVVAERLWSDASVNSITEATPRLEEHRCRLLARGYDAEPLGHGKPLKGKMISIRTHAPLLLLLVTCALQVSSGQSYIYEAGSVLEPLETGDENQKEEKSVNERNPLRKEALDLSSVVLAGNEGNSCSVDATVISTLLAQLVHRRHKEGNGSVSSSGEEAEAWPPSQESSRPPSTSHTASNVEEEVLLTEGNPLDLEAPMMISEIIQPETISSTNRNYSFYWKN
ncbi:Glycoside hydrolase family 20 catalytic domain [Trinorchestia longiramus]|nr:Glycoside hydrolase family 20 catalytic domain [Trinorchestia longiramus]